MELSIVMPCLNEEETLANCIQQAKSFLDTSDIVGEVIIADNGSTDSSVAIAEASGARVVVVEEKGYGAALMGGIKAASGTYVAMGDADESYDFGSLGPFIDSLRSGSDLVMGNRFAGGIESGAMPWLHKYIGNPVLSFIGRLFFRVKVRDFHCGLRAFKRDSILALQLRTTGMEFASEMVVKAALNDLVIDEKPTTLSLDGRSRKPHLRSFRDGWRHLRFLLLYSPRWLFLYPGALLTCIGLLSSIALIRDSVQVGAVGFDIGTLLYAVAISIVGYQGVLFALLARMYAASTGFLPTTNKLDNFFKRVTVELGIIVGALVGVFGLTLSALSLLRWSDAGYGDLNPSETIRTVVPGILGIVMGAQTVLAGLFGELLKIKVKN